MSRKMLITSILVAGSLMASGCNGGSADNANGGSNDAAGVTIVATEFAFDPSSFSLAAGQQTQLTLENRGVVEHDLVVEEIGDVELVYANAGESVTESVTLEAGTYTFYCSIPGHRQAGMEGTLTVQ